MVGPFDEPSPWVDDRIDDRTVEPDQAKDSDDALRDPEDRNESGATQKPEVEGVRDPDRMIHVHDLIDAPDQDEERYGDTQAK